MNERRAQLLIVGTKLSNDRELYRTIGYSFSIHFLNITLFFNRNGL